MKPSRYLQILICLMILFICHRSYAQSSSNYLQFNLLSSLNFHLSTASDFENDQTINSAFSLSIKCKNNSSVYVKLYSWTHPSGFTPPYCPIQVDYTSDTSPNATNIATSPVTVTSSDQLLFKQGKTKGRSPYYFYYNLKMLAVGYDYVPGTYSFTLMFTMTQP
jgi:hypothetical protein